MEHRSSGPGVPFSPDSSRNMKYGNDSIPRPSCYAVIPAAGQGLRMGTSLQKQFLDLRGKPILAVTIEVFERCAGIDGIILVTPADRLDFCRNEIVARYHFRKVRDVVPGGEQRQDSVFNGLCAVPEATDLVAIHDGVRPLVTVELIERTILAAYDRGAALAAQPAQETVKLSQDGATVSRTLDRNRIFLAQTPQTFRLSLILEAHRKAGERQFYATDDAMLVEELGYAVQIVPGIPQNVKITTPADLRLAEALGNESIPLTNP